MVDEICCFLLSDSSKPEASAEPARSAAPVVDVWADEDVDDTNVVDSWDAEPEENKPKIAPPVKPKNQKKLKTKEKEEEERKKREADEEERKAAEAAMTPEERSAKKRAEQLRVEEADHEFAQDLFSVDSVKRAPVGAALDVAGVTLKTKEDFDKFGKAIGDRMAQEVRVMLLFCCFLNSRYALMVLGCHVGRLIHQHTHQTSVRHHEAG